MSEPFETEKVGYNADQKASAALLRAVVLDALQADFTVGEFVAHDPSSSSGV